MKDRKAIMAKRGRKRRRLGNEKGQCVQSKIDQKGGYCLEQLAKSSAFAQVQPAHGREGFPFASNYKGPLQDV